MSARAEDTVTVTTNYYAIAGLTAWELRAAMAKARPWKESDGRDGRRNGTSSGVSNCGKVRTVAASVL